VHPKNEKNEKNDVTKRKKKKTLELFFEFNFPPNFFLSFFFLFERLASVQKKKKVDF